MLLDSIHAGLQILEQLITPREVLVLRRHECREIPQELRLLLRIQLRQLQSQFGISCCNYVVGILQLTFVLVEGFCVMFLANARSNASQHGVVLASSFLTLLL